MGNALALTGTTGTGTTGTAAWSKGAAADMARDVWWFGGAGVTIPDLTAGGGDCDGDGSMGDGYWWRGVLAVVLQWCSKRFHGDK
jgi:hypothetical protein